MTTDKRNADDPKGLIYEAYRIDGITAAECRSIFLDWALSLGMDNDVKAAIRRLLAVHAGDGDGHPMTDVLREGLHSMPTPRRRGGWRSRPRD
ncbi:hypothetical protein [Sulfitobacter sp. S190]|uniref:hypothetical protein n=1 Tax=Sulfitobacter sp. S190 TaxID=2867022 RepID=UPI0021A6BBCC|nr:hypothetical protein [Sulfitobacter sp. S190]